MAKSNKNNPLNIDVDIKERALRRVRDHLETAIDDAVRTKDIKALSVRIQNMILLRTQRGYFLDGDGGKEKRYYQSESHKAKRSAMGLQTSHVSLFMGELGLLEALVARGKMKAGKPTIEVGYLEGLSESKAIEIAKYMNEQGVGTNHILYPYVGLTDDERETAIDYLRDRVGKNLDSGL